MTRGTIAKIESGGRKSVTAEEIAVLAHVLRTTPTELLATPDWRFDRGPAIPDVGRLHLTISVEHDGIDPNLTLVSCWRQEDPMKWPPARTNIGDVAIDDLEAAVDECVLAAEQAWVNHSDEVTLEFVLPRSLMHLPVHHWHKELRSGSGSPLSLDYTIYVRSLDRMRSAHLHRMWRTRWLALREDPSPDRIYFATEEELEQRDRFDAILRDPRWLATVLSAPPSHRPETPSHTDEFTSDLRAGIPALIWHPHQSGDDVREFVHALVEHDGLADLPACTRAARMSAFRTGGAFDDITRDLVLLWDDATRVVPMNASGNILARV